MYKSGIALSCPSGGGMRGNKNKFIIVIAFALPTQQCTRARRILKCNRIKGSAERVYTPRTTKVLVALSKCLTIWRMALF